MKRTLLFFTLFLVFSCSGNTKYGKCIGAFQEGKDNLVYEVSIRNAVFSILGIETIIAPILWLTDYAKCPVGDKETK